MKKVFNLDNELVDWNINNHLILTQRPRSALHIKCRQLLKDIYPACQVLEEVDIPTYKFKKPLYLDFYIPIFKTAIEVHGEQHYSFSTMFHGTKRDLLMQRKKDGEKKDWCELNGIRLVVLPYNEELDEWRRRISTDTNQATT